MSHEHSAPLLHGPRLKHLAATRADGRSALRLVLQLGIFFGAFAALLLLSGSTPPARAPWGLARLAVLALLSFSLFALYAPFHEATHRTAFSSPRVNDAVAWLTGLFYGYSPGMHRAFHFEHHRRLNQPGDPELGFGLPAMPLRLMWQALLVGMLGALVPLHSMILAVAPTRTWDRLLAPWAPRSRRTRLAWECRLVALLWIGGIAASLAYTNLTLELLLVLVGARTIHGLVSVSEHEDLPSEGPMIDRSRTVTTHPIFHWFWWNMSYHAEHHAWAALPWHQLPAAHALVRDDLPHVERGYLSFLGRRIHGTSLSPRVRT